MSGAIQQKYLDSIGWEDAWLKDKTSVKRVGDPDKITIGVVMALRIKCESSLCLLFTVLNLLLPINFCVDLTQNMLKSKLAKLLKLTKPALKKLADEPFFKKTYSCQNHTHHLP